MCIRFYLLATWMTVGYKHLRIGMWMYDFILLGSYLGVEWLGYMITLCVSCWGAASLLSRELSHPAAHIQSHFSWKPITREVIVSVSSKQGKKGKLPLALDAVASCRDKILGRKAFVLLSAVFLALSLGTISTLWLHFEWINSAKMSPGSK